MTPKKHDEEPEEFKLPPLPSIEDAQSALSKAEEVYALTPALQHEQKVAADIFVDAIMKAIAQRGV